jgi:hypothetical protein
MPTVGAAFGAKWIVAAAVAGNDSNRVESGPRH